MVLKFPQSHQELWPWWWSVPHCWSWWPWHTHLFCVLVTQWSSSDITWEGLLALNLALLLLKLQPSYIICQHLGAIVMFSVALSGQDFSCFITSGWGLDGICMYRRWVSHLTSLWLQPSLPCVMCPVSRMLYTQGTLRLLVSNSKLITAPKLAMNQCLPDPLCQ
jgi:hypothetical protein